MHIRIIAALLATATLAAACSPSPGSAEWCKGVIEGSVKPTPEEMLNNIDTCAKHELAG